MLAERLREAEREHEVCRGRKGEGGRGEEGGDAARGISTLRGITNKSTSPLAAGDAKPNISARNASRGLAGRTVGEGCRPSEDAERVRAAAGKYYLREEYKKGKLGGKVGGIGKMQW